MVEKETILLVNHPEHVIYLTRIVEDGVALQWEMCGEPCVRVVKRRADDIDLEDKRRQNIKNSPNRHDKW